MFRNRLAALLPLVVPLLLVLLGTELLTAGAIAVLRGIFPQGYPLLIGYLTLQFLPTALRAALLLIAGVVVLVLGARQIGKLAVIRLDGRGDGKELVLGYHKDDQPPRIVVLSGGAGMFIMASLVQQVERLTCITPINDPVEYYYRASSLFNAGHVDYVPPTPAAARVIAELDDGTQVDLRQIRKLVADPLLAERHIARLELQWTADDQNAQGISRVVRDAIAEADAIVLGPGSLFESILPNLLISDLRDVIVRSSARTIYVCNLMTEPGLTTGFDVSDHIRAIREYGGFTPNYVLVNAQRIDSEVRRMYGAAMQVPVLIDPESYEETAVVTGEDGRRKELLVEGATVMEADLSSALVQYTASINDPSERRAVRVLRHDPDKLAAAILALLRRE